MEWLELERRGLCPAGLAAKSERGGFCQREGDVTIQYCLFRQRGAKKHVIILTGWDESFLKYGWEIEQFLRCGYNVYTMDHRSQGLSGRHLPANPQITHVESFDDYVNDALYFVREVIVRRCGVAHASEVKVLAHSMGGFVATLLAARPGHPAGFSRLACSAPMYRMRTGMPHFVAYAAAAFGCACGWGERYAPGEGDVDPGGVIKKKLTTCSRRVARLEALRRAFPQVAMGGMSFRWVLEALKAQYWLKRPENAAKVAVPVLLLCSDDDVFVCNAAFRRFQRHNDKARLVLYRGTYHEILMERDATRTHAFEEIVHFFECDDPAVVNHSRMVAVGLLPPLPPALVRRRRRWRRRIAAAAAGLCIGTGLVAALLGRCRRA